jgi:YcaO-like protein with predicted kinase domain
LKTTFRQIADFVGITRVSFLTHYDSLGIPVASAVHPGVGGEQITAHQGKALRSEQALIAAIMEALERHAASRVKGDRVASPAALLRTGEHGFDVEGKGAAGDEAAVEWVEGRCLFSGARLWVQMERVAFPYLPPSGMRTKRRPSTTGLAAHGTLDAAITQALLEVFERDAVRRFLEGEPARRLRLETVGEPVLRSLIDRFAACGIALHVVDLSPIAAVPAFIAYAIERGGFLPNLPIAGQGAHFNASRALSAALLEVAQSRIAAIQGSREDFARHGAVWNASAEEAAELLKEIEDRVNGLTDWSGLSRKRRARRMGVAAEPASVLGTRQPGTVAVCDLSAYAHGVPTVRVCVRGMRDAVS